MKTTPERIRDLTKLDHGRVSLDPGSLYSHTIILSRMTENRFIKTPYSNPKMAP